jgi:hypothetical protein
VQAEETRFEPNQIFLHVLSTLISTQELVTSLETSGAAGRPGIDPGRPLADLAPETRASSRRRKMLRWQGEPHRLGYLPFQLVE